MRKMELKEIWINFYKEDFLMAEIVKCDFMCTGGGFWSFWGKLSDNTYFMMDTGNFDVRILKEDPQMDTNEDSWYVDWQEERLVRDLDSIEEGPAFMLACMKWLREHDIPYLSSLSAVEEKAKQLAGNKEWK